jgi:hypothetical protein
MLPVASDYLAVNFGGYPMERDSETTIKSFAQKPEAVRIKRTLVNMALNRAKFLQAFQRQVLDLT